MTSTSPIVPQNRPHSSSVSSVHFALPPRRLASGSGLAFEAIPAPRSADAPKTESGSPSKPTSLPNFYPNPPTSDRRTSAASVLKGGKRASVVTGGWESSSGEDRGRFERPRATTIALPASTPPPVAQRLPASRHSSRDILRSSVFRPVPFSSSSSRSLASPSKARDASPVRRKGKERAEPRRDLLASSLGLASGTSGPALTSDQINNLLADSDVATAIRYMGAPVPTVSAEPHQPFLVSAPPALTFDHSRSRTISMSTTASSPRQNTDRRRRASSRAIDEGGHIPFTHHVTPLALESDEGEETEPTAPAADEPKTVESLLAPPKKRKRISALFGLKHKSSDSSIRTEAPSVVSLPTDTEEKTRREAIMREKERQRRLDEIEEERYFHALQQVSAHPHSVQLADQAKVHLWALYEDVFDGLENPPRYNPVAILRWKHKVLEQEAARRAWSARRGGSVESLASARTIDAFGRWTFSLDDVERYKQTEGHVDYFIPPSVIPSNGVQTLPLASVDELVPASSEGSVRAVSNPSAVSMVKPSESRQSFEPLSRTPSNEPNRFRKTHRTHQSLGHLGPISMAHKISSMARRQKTLPMGDVSDSTMDDSPLRANQPMARSKTDRFLRRQPEPRGFMTDEEFIVEPRPQPIRAEPPAPAAGPSPEDLSRRQAVAKQKEVYAERAKKLRAAQAGLQQVDAAIAIVDDNIKHYGARLEQVQISAQIATGVSLSDRMQRGRLEATAQRLSELGTLVDDMENVRFEAADRLRGMVKTINRMQSKTSEVDKWARKSTLEIEELKRARARLLAKRDKQAFWLRRGLDWYYNAVARSMGFFIRTSYRFAQYPFRCVGLQRTRHDGRRMTRWEQAWYMVPTWTFVGMLCIFYLVGGWID